MEQETQAYDDAMFEFSQGNYDRAIELLSDILRGDPAHFDAQLSLGMAYCRKGDFARAIEEGHVAERMRPNEQLVHTNLSLFYMRAGDKKTAEHHGLQARIASWKGNMAPPTPPPAAGSVEQELQWAKPSPAPMAIPEKFPDMPWRKQARVGAPGPGAAAEGWTMVEGAESMAEGAGRTFIVAGLEIALYRVGDRYYAVDDRCPHREASLGAGYQERGQLYCPMHGWKFDLATGAGLTNPERPVRTHSTEMRNGKVWVRVSPRL